MLMKVFENKKHLKLQIIGLIIWIGGMCLLSLDLLKNYDALFIIPISGCLLFACSFALCLFKKTQKERLLIGLVLIILIILGFLLQIMALGFPLLIALVATLATLAGPCSHVGVGGGE